MSSTRKLFFMVLALIVLLGAAYTEYYFYFSKSQALVVVSDSSNLKKATTGEQKPFTISYSYSTTTVFVDDEQGGITYLTVSGLASVKAQESINRELKRSLTESCFGDPDDKNSLESIRSLYEGARDYQSDSKTKKVEVDTLSYEAVRQKLVKDFDFYDSTEQEVVYANNNVLSIKVHNNNNCGGVHPNYETYGYTFNVLTGEVLSFDKFFKNFTQDKKKIESIVFPYLQSKNDASNECNYEDDYKSQEIDLSNLTSAVLSSDGVAFISLGYSHAQTACEPEPAIIIPYSLLLPYLNVDALFMQSVIQIKKRASSP